MTETPVYYLQQPTRRYVYQTASPDRFGSGSTPIPTSFSFSDFLVMGASECLCPDPLPATSQSYGQKGTQRHHDEYIDTAGKAFRVHTYLLFIALTRQSRRQQKHHTVQMFHSRHSLSLQYFPSSGKMFFPQKWHLGRTFGFSGLSRW